MCDSTVALILPFNQKIVQETNKNTISPNQITDEKLINEHFGSKQIISTDMVKSESDINLKVNTDLPLFAESIIVDNQNNPKMSSKKKRKKFENLLTKELVVKKAKQNFDEDGRLKFQQELDQNESLASQSEFRSEIKTVSSIDYLPLTNNENDSFQLTVKNKIEKQFFRQEKVKKKAKPLFKDHKKFSEFYVSPLNDFTKEKAGNLISSSTQIVWFKCPENKKCKCLHICFASVHTLCRFNLKCFFCTFIPRSFRLCKCALERKYPYLRGLIFCWFCQEIMTDEKKYYQDSTFVICYNCVNFIYRQDLFKRLLRYAHNHAKRMKSRPEEAKKCTLTLQKLEKKWQDQNQLCYISKSKAVFNGPELSKFISLERINNNRGYVEGNFCLILRLFQTGDFSHVKSKYSDLNQTKLSCQWTREKFEQFLFLRQNEITNIQNLQLETKWTEECKQKMEEARNHKRLDWKRTWTKKRNTVRKITYKTGENKIFENVLTIECANSFKLHQENEKEIAASDYQIYTSKKTGQKYFSKNCKKCRSHYQRTIKSSVRGKVNCLINEARRKDQEEGFNQNETITREEILKKCFLQRGRCYYSFIRLNWELDRYWTVSLDRLDRTKGHTNANTVLCGLEFNTPAAWKREYVEEFWSSV